MSSCVSHLPDRNLGSICSAGTGNGRKATEQSGSQARVASDEERQGNWADVIGIPPAASPPPRQRQTRATLDDFVEGPCNALALSSALHVARRPGHYSPLLLFGPTATGKTHLLEVIRADVRRRHQRANVLYLTAEQFTSAFVEAIGQRKLPSFRHKFRGVDFSVAR